MTQDFPNTKWQVIELCAGSALSGLHVPDNGGRRGRRAIRPDLSDVGNVSTVYKAFHDRNSLVAEHNGNFFTTTMAPVLGNTGSGDPGQPDCGIYATDAKI